MARALVNLPKTAKAGEVFEIKTLVSHPMETGYRPGPDGNLLPRNIITRFRCEYDGATVFEAVLFPAMAANPYLLFTTVATRSGPMTLTWEGDDGFRQVETVTIEVA